MKLRPVILSDAESVGTGSCTRREQRDVSFQLSACGLDKMWCKLSEFVFKNQQSYVRVRICTCLHTNLDDIKKM